MEGKTKKQTETKQQQLLYEACRMGQVSVVNELLYDKEIQFGDCMQKAIIIASECGFGAILARLLHKEGTQMPPCYSNLIEDASKKGYNDVVHILISCSAFPWFPHQGKTGNFLMACSKGYKEAVKLLVNDPTVDITSRGKHNAVWQAWLNGSYDIVKFLLADERVDPFHLCHQSVKFKKTPMKVMSSKLLRGHGVVFKSFKFLNDDWKGDHTNFQFYPEIVKKSIFQFLLIAERRKKELKLYKDIRLVLVSYIIKAGVKDWGIQRKRKIYGK